MKTYILSIFIFCCAIWSLKGQNLVPNPSFEIYDTCPTTLSRIDLCTGWFSCGATPDYFNTCSPTAGISPPDYNFGYQWPHSGNAFAAVMTLHYNDSSYREIIGTQLLVPMEINKKYYFSFFVNMAQIVYTIATNNMGMRFSTVQYSISNPISINNFAQFHTDSIIQDTANWVQLKGSFIADSTYDYVMIGNFFDELHTNALLNLGPYNIGADYNIDDVCITTDSLYNEHWTGIAKSDDKTNLLIYPNPTHNIITIEGTALKSYTIIDMLGRKYKEAEFADASQNTIYVGDLPKGMYFVAVKTLAGSWVGKVVVQ